MSLKSSLDDANSPLREFWGRRLPNTSDPVAHYKGQLLGAVTTLPANAEVRPPWDLLGHAISARLLWELEPAPSGCIATVGYLDALGLFEDLAILEQYMAIAATHPSTLDGDTAVRVASVVGLIDRAERSGRWDDPTIERLGGALDLAAALSIIPKFWVDDLAAMTDRCLPLIAPHRSTEIRIAPTFDGSTSVGGADADYITADGTLIDIKATKDPKLRVRDLRQIVSYALLDWTDQYHITSVGILATRQARLVTWPLDRLLAQLAGRPVTIAELRVELEAALT